MFKEMGGQIVMLDHADPDMPDLAHVPVDVLEALEPERRLQRTAYARAALNLPSNPGSRPKSI
jgi:hypothetical protein